MTCNCCIFTNEIYSAWWWWVMPFNGFCHSATFYIQGILSTLR